MSTLDGKLQRNNCIELTYVDDVEQNILFSIKGNDGEWELEEFGQSISDLASMVGPFNTEKRVVESLTSAHTSTPEDLGFSVSDDIVSPRIPVRPMQSAGVAADPQPQPELDVVPAAEDAELPVADGSMVLDLTPTLL